MVKLYKIRLYILIILCTYIQSAYAQLYNFRHYTVENGIPQSEIKALFQDSKGFMWMGTEGGGVCRFDGSKFTAYSVKQGLAGIDVNSITEDEEGRIWIATREGVSVISKDTIISYRIADGLPANEALAVFCDRKKNLWIGTQKGLCKFDPGNKSKKFIVYPSPYKAEFDSINCITQDKEGFLIIGTTRGIRYFDPERSSENPDYTLITLNDSIGNDIRAITSDPYNKYWVGDAAGNVSVIENFSSPQRRIKMFTKKDGLPSAQIHDIAIDRNQHVWLATNAGCVKIIRDDTKEKNYEFERLTRREGLTDNICQSILLDRESNIWIGTYNGVCVFTSNRFAVFSEKNGLPYNTVWSVTGDNDGNIWVGTDTALARIILNPGDREKSGKQILAYTHRDGLVSPRVTAIHLDSKGNLWFGHSRSVSMLPASEVNKSAPRFITYKTENGFLGGLVTDITEDSKGMIWFATYKGLVKYDGKKFTTYTKKEGLISELLRNVIEDRQGNLWITSDGGLTKYDGMRFLNYTKIDGMSSNDIVSLLEDYDGNLWIGTHNAGILMYDGLKFISFNEDHGLRSNTVFSMIMDIEGNVWIGSNIGIDRLDVKEFKRSGRKIFRHYGKNEGFEGIECNQNAVYMDFNGNLWFGTVKGLIRYSPGQDKLNTVPPLTHITNIKLFLKEVDWKKHSDKIDMKTGLPSDLILSHDQNSVTFNFLALSHTIPDQVRYRYVLEGLDKEWSPVVAESYAHYTNLEPGKYTFRIKACNNDNIWNTTPTSFSFVINPPFYKTWWFYTLCFISITVSIFSFVKWRERTLKFQKKSLERQVAQRTVQLKQEKEKLETAYSEIGTKNKEITDSIRYAKHLQDAILPPAGIVQKLLPDSFILYKPKDIVSGDFYWIDKAGGKVLFAAVDCTGHGVPGAFMSIIGNNLLNQTVKEREFIKPGLILNELNSSIGDTLRQSNDEFMVKDGMDIALCTLDLNKGGLEFSGANNPLWIIHPNGHEAPAIDSTDPGELLREIENIPLGGIEEVKGDKQPIGKFVNETLKNFTNHERKLSKGDTIYIFSDGYADQFGGPTGKKFKYKQLKKLLLAIRNRTMSEQKEILEKVIELWRGKLEQVDDILVIGVRV